MSTLVQYKPIETHHSDTANASKLMKIDTILIGQLQIIRTVLRIHNYSCRANMTTFHSDSKSLNFNIF